MANSLLRTVIHSFMSSYTGLPRCISHSTQSQPGPKGPLALYVHTQETVDHTLLRVAVCNTTVVSRLSVHARLLNQKRKRE